MEKTYAKEDHTRLTELERARQELTSIMAHDMLNLIHGIVGFFDLTDRGTLTPQAPEFAEFMSMASQYSRELMLIINSILDVYKLEDGRLALNRRPVQLLELITYSMEQVRPLAVQHEVDLTLDMPEDLPLLDVDGEVIVRVLSNLLFSAIKATPPGGLVSVTAATQPGIPAMVRVSVSDTGESISAEELTQIFERFYQPARRGYRRSIGVGLTFCKQAVELHGGRIWAESEPDRGNTFHLTLPIVL
ncbi:MAG: HAMP domain-containing histidine kinase [Anaerolineae bacterium]|jgi:signal transduction histidine kinase|nr:HAMP domain-containing histidine kinase [Anaerolineae bacterium]MDH7473855.1 HAMP domain-containing sensor histidine kinase [Anaerolineae bacterium]